ncbi:enolase C-terminal domain-like protein, partial [Mycobacterium sp.]|uniref:enolase C-terminal domain-like protein n=1 Tax=Mycobacterium sp. TaxID=1785 RepID=UPI0026279C6B
MRIAAIIERAVGLGSGRRPAPANAVVNFSHHTVSVVAVITDVIRHGRPVVGVAFDSIGRFAQSGILRDRMIPRVLAASPDALLDASGLLDPAAVLACALTDEKPGGHGDRAAAAGALELACWDLNAKLRDEPACVTIARHAGREPAPAVPMYAAGGYYYAEGGAHQLRREIRGYLDLGYDAVKMKIGGATLDEDLARIEAVIDIVGDAGRVAVDANGRFDRDEAIRWASALAPYGLRWYE